MVVATTQANQIETKDFSAIFAAEIGDGERHTIAIDAEWDSKIKLTLGYALVVEAKYKFVVLNEAIRDNSIKDKKGKKIEVPKEIIERIEKYCQANDYILQWMPLSDDSCDATSTILREYGIEKGCFNVLMYYSPKDLNVSFGFKNLKPFYNKKKITQKKRLSGTYINTDTDTETKTKTKNELKYRICDLKGWSNTKLKDFAASVGVEMKSKDKMDDYKTHMLDGLIAEPETFLDYMVGDTTCLFEIRVKFIENIQWLQRDVIKLPEDKVYEDDKIPLTIGSIVAGTLEKYIRFGSCPVERQDEYNYALLKLGIIKEKTQKKDEVTALHDNLREKIKDSQTFAENWLKVTDLIEEHWKQYRFTAYSQCSVGYFGLETKTSEAYLALVQGGRCTNEQSWRYRLDHAADIDLKSAYASVLRRIDYPIGLPTITSFTPNEPRWSLEEWFKHTKVLDGTNRNWMVVVQGNLSFSQDLLFSKVTTQSKINKAIVKAVEDDIRSSENRNQNDDAHIEGKFILARRELKNAVITSDIWETILKVASTQELKELRGLQIVAAAYYREEDRCADANEWIDKVLACNSEYVTDKSTGRITDKRTRAWFSIPLEDVFGKIIDTRNQLKSEAKKANAEGNHEDYLKLNGRQEALKLFVNTGYGVLASPYFSIGNTVIGNNITAQIRLAVWQMNKALNTCQSITDGGLYELGKVNKLHPKLRETGKRKPGLETLSDLRELHKHRSVAVGSLGRVDWQVLIDSLFENELTPEDKEILKNHDALALQHIKNFWAVYELDFHFNVEHKTVNYARRVAYWSKADYALDRVDGERHYKIRGAKKNANRKNHPKFELFDNILALDDTFPDNMNYIFSCLLKVGKFKTIQDSNGYKDYKDLQPGDEYEEKRKAQFNNTHIAVNKIQDYLRRDKRTKEEDKKIFEKYGAGGIWRVHKIMLLDNLLIGIKSKSD